MQSSRWLPIADKTPQCLATGYLLLTRHHGVWQMVTYCWQDTMQSGRWLPIADKTPRCLADCYLLLMYTTVWHMVTYWW